MEDDVYNGMHIPKGSLVFGNIWYVSLAHLTSVFHLPFSMYQGNATQRDHVSRPWVFPSWTLHGIVRRPHSGQEEESQELRFRIWKEAMPRSELGRFLSVAVDGLHASYSWYRQGFWWLWKHLRARNCLWESNLQVCVFFSNLYYYVLIILRHRIPNAFKCDMRPRSQKAVTLIQQSELPIA